MKDELNVYFKLLSQQWHIFTVCWENRVTEVKILTQSQVSISWISRERNTIKAFDHLTVVQ